MLCDNETCNVHPWLDDIDALEIVEFWVFDDESVSCQNIQVVHPSGSSDLDLPKIFDRH